MRKLMHLARLHKFISFTVIAMISVTCFAFAKLERHYVGSSLITQLQSKIQQLNSEEKLSAIDKPLIADSFTPVQHLSTPLVRHYDVLFKQLTNGDIEVLRALPIALATQPFRWSEAKGHARKYGSLESMVGAQRTSEADIAPVFYPVLLAPKSLPAEEVLRQQTAIINSEDSDGRVRFQKEINLEEVAQLRGPGRHPDYPLASQFPHTMKAEEPLFRAVVPVFAGGRIVVDYDGPATQLYIPTADAAPKLSTNPASLRLLGNASAGSAQTLTTANGRFEVEVDWQTPKGATGLGQPLVSTDDTGMFWFFNPNNIEMVVKILDACKHPRLKGYWVFATGLTNVGVNMRITDTWTGAVETFNNPVSQPFQPIQRTDTFASSCGAKGSQPAQPAAPLVASADKVDILILGDGYTSTMQSDFDTQAQAMVDGFFKDEPFAQYADAFQFHQKFLFHPDETDPGITYDCAGISDENGLIGTRIRKTVFGFKRCGLGDSVRVSWNYQQILDKAAEILPGVDQIWVMVPDSYWGGQGAAKVSYFTNPPQYAEDIARHEFMHSFAGLADTYVPDESICRNSPPPTFCTTPAVCSDQPGASVMCRFNVTDNIEDPLFPIWRPFITAGTSLPTQAPPGAVATAGSVEPVGAYVGANYNLFNMYRPHYQGIMFQVDQPSGIVNNHGFLHALYTGEVIKKGWTAIEHPADGIRLIDADSVFSNPAPDAGGIITVNADDNLQLGFNHLQFSTENIEWFVGTQKTSVLSGRIARATPASLGLQSGTHRITAKIKDASNWLINPGKPEHAGADERLLTINETQDEYQWTVNVQPGSAPGCNITAAEEGKALCLDGRFKVTIAWARNNGDTGTGNSIEFTNNTGMFWFFNASNVELIIKVLNGCGSTGHYWVFAAGLTNVGTTLTVTDTVTGNVWTPPDGQNPIDTPFAPIQDIRALSCS